MYARLYALSPLMGVPASAYAEPVTAAAGIELDLTQCSVFQQNHRHDIAAWQLQDACFAARATMAPPRPAVADSAVDADKLTAEIVAEEKK